MAVTLRKSNVEGNIPYFRDTFIWGHGFAFFWVRSNELRWPQVGKPQSYATSFPVSFPSSWSLVERLQELNKIQSNGISQACLESEAKASLTISLQLNSLQLVLPVPRDLFYRTNDKTHTSHSSTARLLQKTFYAQMAASEFFAVKTRREDWRFGRVIYNFSLYFFLESELSGHKLMHLTRTSIFNPLSFLLLLIPKLCW